MQCSFLSTCCSISLSPSGRGGKQACEEGEGFYMTIPFLMDPRFTDDNQKVTEGG